MGVALVMADKLAVITEKEALAAKYAELEAHLAKVLAGEMEAEAIAESAAARVKKDMAAMERKKDSEIAQLQHENQVANDQKNRIRDEEQRAKEQLKAKKRQGNRDPPEDSRPQGQGGGQASCRGCKRLRGQAQAP